MWTRSVVGLLVVSIVVSGCLDAGAPSASGPETGERPSVSLAERTVFGSDVLSWKGSEIGEGDSETWLLNVTIPTGYWTSHRGGLDVILQIDPRDRVGLEFKLTHVESGKSWEGEGYADYLAVVPSPESGQYRLDVEARAGMASYKAFAQIDAAPVEEGPARPLLPNLVTLVPTELTLRSSSCNWVPVVYECIPPVQSAAGVRGCSLFEFVEEQTRRCLRFSNRIGNVGEGQFEVQLKDKGLGTKERGMVEKGQWIQRIWHSDGSVQEVEVGEAAYHATHGHFHYQGMAHYQLYKYDRGSHVRGGSAAEGRKVGFCFLDMRLVAPGLPFTSMPADFKSGCGLSPNWYDLYWYTLDEQYIDVTNVPDGTYELVSTANFLKNAKESDLTDNSASVVFTMAGTTITIHEDEPPGQKAYR